MLKVNNIDVFYGAIHALHDVSIEVNNVIGEVVSIQINEKLEKGMHKYTFSAKKLGLPAGIYNVKLNINGVITSKNMIELE